MNFPSAPLVGHCHYKSGPMKSITQRNAYGLQKNRTEARVSDGKKPKIIKHHPEGAVLTTCRWQCAQLLLTNSTRKIPLGR